MLTLVVLFIHSLYSQGNQAFTYTYNGQKRTGSITVDQEWRGDGTPTADVKLADFGVTVSGDSVSQKFYTGNTTGSRLYLLDPTGKAYEKFKLINAEITFDLDTSQIPCGMVAAIYTAEMPADGVTPGHEAGAAYGGGYCDANYVGGIGCGEFDIIEGNAHATQVTSHGCTPSSGFYKQGSISCDTGGTASNWYRQDHNFFGNGSSFTVNSGQKITVVTQFKGSGSSLSSIDRIFIQGGKQTKMDTRSNSGLDRVSASFNQGHVLIFSIWSAEADVCWLDCPDNGPCKNDGQIESRRYLQQHYANATVTYSNVRFGPIDSTY